MIAFLLVVYTAIVIVLVKVGVVRAQPYPIALVVVAGIFIIGGVVAAWTLCAPVSMRVVASHHIVQIVPYVKGQIKKLYARPLQPLHQGDPLLDIDPAPYQFAVNQLEAQLQSSKDNVEQSAAGLEAARANVKKSEAAVGQAVAAVNTAKAGVAGAEAAAKKAGAADELAKIEEQMDLEILKENAVAISRLKVDQATQNRKQADAAYEQAQTDITQAQAASAQAEAALAEAQAAQLQAAAAASQSEAALKVATSGVAVIQAQLDHAQFNLTQCHVTAPADGFVVNWQVQEGTMLVPLPLAPAGTFINTSETGVVAVFPQNYLMNVEPGNDVELVLNSYPGRLFNAKVECIVEATGEGQFAPGGEIPRASTIGSQGLLAVRIILPEDEAKSLNIPLGAGGVVAIYTEHGKSVHIISKVAIRMKKWLLYVLPT
ncbi:MAG TPA: efflux RND transporter periplasmic adaptor subunit [Lacipirellulaceae bacterium]|jgi:multidrug resistance efflux pump